MPKLDDFRVGQGVVSRNAVSSLRGMCLCCFPCMCVHCLFVGLGFCVLLYALFSFICSCLMILWGGLCFECVFVCFQDNRETHTRTNKRNKIITQARLFSDWAGCGFQECGFEFGRNMCVVLFFPCFVH